MQAAKEKPAVDCNGVEVRAGALCARFVDGELRHLRFGSIEVVRRIFVGVRDRSWGTVSGKVSGVEMGGDNQRRTIAFKVDHKRDDISFTWHGLIELACDASRKDDLTATISFAIEGQSLRSFQTNRTGICVLHPVASCAGRPLRVTRSDGSVGAGEFPEFVQPDQIASEIVGLQYKPAPGLIVKIGFEGEVFETEDQRNWADGSYKTYCRPLSRVFPYELAAQDRVWQRVVVQLEGRAVLRLPQDDLTLSIGGRLGPLPGIGLCERPGAAQMPALKALALSHVRVDVRLGSEGWRAALLQSAEQSRLLAIPVELAIHLPVAGHAGLEELPALAARLGVNIIRWLVYRDRRPMVLADDFDTVAEAIRCIAPKVIVGWGTIGSFAELNRNRPPTRGASALAWSVCPQVHGTDDDTLIESLEGLAGAVETARSFAPGSHLAVGPVCFWRTPDPFAAGNDGVIKPAAPDGRLTTAFGAAWTLGCISTLAQAKADSITLYQTVGALGVIDGSSDSPLYGLLGEIGEFANGQVLECKSSDPTRSVGLAIQLGGRVRIWVASLTHRSTPIKLTGDFGSHSLQFDAVGVQHLDLEMEETG